MLSCLSDALLVVDFCSGSKVAQHPGFASVM